MTDLIDRVAQKIDPGAFADPAPSAERARARLMAAPIIRLVLEEAAQLVECDCPHKAEVLSHPPNSGARWRACLRDDCAAINAAEIRALAEPSP